MQYCSLQHQTLLLTPATSTTGYLFFLLWLHPFILSGVIFPLIPSSILGTYLPGEFIFQCHIFLPFHTVHMTCSLFKYLVFPVGSDGKESACSAGEPISIPGLGRSPGEGNDNPLQYSCLENSVDRGAWWATVLGVMKSWTLLRD